VVGRLLRQELLSKVVFECGLKEAAFFEMSWLRNKDQFSPKETPPMKNRHQKSVYEMACGIDTPEVASENSATREVKDVLSQILREGAQRARSSAVPTRV
jgi:hypothetical protein